MTANGACTSPANEPQLPEQVPFMNTTQFRRAKKLVRSLCANHDYGNCVLLENRFGTCVCPQLISYSLICKYFRTAVLPMDKELHAEIMETDKLTYCYDCQQPFVPDRKRTIFCRTCADRHKRQCKREWARKNRCKK